MINYHCPNCKRTTERQKKRVLIVCGCGYEMVLIVTSFKRGLSIPRFFNSYPLSYTQGKAIKTLPHSSFIVISEKIWDRVNGRKFNVVVVKSILNSPPLILNSFYLNSCVCSKSQNDKRIYFKNLIG